MIPFTFPSSPSLVTGNAECKIFYLSSVTGLAAWTDYIPVRSYTSSAPVEGTTDAAGYQAVKPLSSTTGLAAWTDYIPVYEDASLTKPWSTDAGGYIPVGAAGSRLSLNFAGTTAIDSRITYSGGSSRTFFGSDGLLKVQGYNLLTYSQDLTNAAWVKSGGEGVTISADAVVAPDGTLTADKVSVLASTGTGANVAANSTSSVSSGSTYTASVYLKAAELSYAHLVLIAGFPTTALSVNLSTGATSIANGTGTPLTPACTDAGNGWWRVSFSLAATSTTAVANLSVYLSQDGLWSSRALARPVGAGIYMWGAQLEPGSTASQYSPTTTAANSAPRLDYDPATLLPRGLLVEEQRTNNETNGIAFTKGVAGDTVTQNAVGPDGLTSAYSIAGDGTSSGSHIVYQASVTPTSGNTYTISVFLKAGTQSLVQLFTASAHSGATVYCNYNLSTAAMTAGAGIVSGSNFCTSVGGGWYRCGFSYVASATAAGVAVVTAPISSISDARSPVVTFSTTYYRFGGQYESTTGMGSATFVTSYIPTTTASATRSSDSVSMTGTNFSSWYNQTQGTFVVESDQTVYAAGTNTVFQANDGTVNNRLFVYTTSSSRQAQVDVGGATQAGLTLSTVTTGASNKVAFAYMLNDFRASMNGGAIISDATGTLPTVNQMLLGGSASGAAASNLNGHIRRLQFYPVALPSATLQSLTA